MNCDYIDITKLTPMTPVWWDEHAVPRYCQFTPLGVANIYASEAALVHIKCQACGHDFLVAFSWDRHKMGTNEDGTVWVHDQGDIDPTALHYGDPPNYCCQSGATMNSEPQRVVEWWRRENHAWVRVPEKEVEIR